MWMILTHDENRVHDENCVRDENYVRDENCARDHEMNALLGHRPLVLKGLHIQERHVHVPRCLV